MRVDFVVPCYNEEEVLDETARRLIALREELIGGGQLSTASRVYFVDDGSRDRTWEAIESLARQENCISGVKLSRNRGHQNALVAGLFTAEGDAVVTIDADLQDDVSAIREMVDQMHKGSAVVYGVRRRRDTDTAFKKWTARSFYKFMALMGAESIPDHSDFRLMTRPAIDALKQFREVNLFLRGLIPLVGFKSSFVYYDRGERFAGESKYPLRKMLAFALEGVTSFSVVPLRVITWLGFFVFLFTACMTGFILWVRIFTDRAIPGWASTVLPVYFLGGIQIMCIGVIGEYLGKLYQEVKDRPRYIIEKMI